VSKLFKKNDEVVVLNLDHEHHRVGFISAERWTIGTCGRVKETLDRLILVQLETALKPDEYMFHEAELMLKNDFLLMQVTRFEEQVKLEQEQTQAIHDWLS